MDTDYIFHNRDVTNLVKVTPFCINFNFNNDYFTWMLENKEELQNINNMNWWRSQKNEEERNMPRHANRSSDWIPNRILKIRQKLIETQLDHLFGEDGHLNGDIWKTPKNHKCMRCNVGIDKLAAYQKGIIKLTEREKQRQLEGDPDNIVWDTILAEAIQRVNSHHDALTIAKSKTLLPTYRSRTLTYQLYGFCIDCWENDVKKKLGYTMDD